MSPPSPFATHWLETPAEDQRAARVETGIPPVACDGGEPIELTLTQWMEGLEIPGLGVALFDRGRLVWAKAHGVKEAGAADPVTLDTLFQAGSISKPVTALAILRHVESGVLSLDADVNESLVSWKLPDNEHTAEAKVTLRRLLSHSAGTTVHGFPGYAVGEPVPSLVQILDGEKPANSDPVRVDLTPGTRFRYSGGGTTIAQLVLVDRLRQPFPVIMDEAVIAPLGLVHSTFEQPLPPDRVRSAASGHRGNGAPVEGRWHVYPEMAAAGLWTTPADLARIALEVCESKAGRSATILSQAMTHEMLTVQAEPVGLGFFLDAKTDRFGHSGTDHGFQAYLLAFADSGSGIVIMASSDNGALLFERLAASAAKEYGWSFEPAPEPPGTTLALIAKLKGVEAALSAYRTRRDAGPEGEFGVNDLSELGYRLLGFGKRDDAVKVFEANVVLHPQEWNAHDCLGEGYLEIGDEAAATKSYRRSLALEPNNENGRKALARLSASASGV